MQNILLCEFVIENEYVEKSVLEKKNPSKGTKFINNL